jgi:MoxR-like ATPase
VTPVLDRDGAPARIARLRQLVRDVLVAPALERWVATLVRLTVPATTSSDTVRRHVTFGASPRGGQALLLGAKVMALLDGRPHVTPADVERAHEALGHRLVSPSARRPRASMRRRGRGARGGARGRP